MRRRMKGGSESGVEWWKGREMRPANAVLPRTTPRCRSNRRTRSSKVSRSRALQYYETLTDISQDDSGSSEAPEDNRPSSSVVMESVEAQSSAKAGSSSPARAHSTKAAKLKEVAFPSNPCMCNQDFKLIRFGGSNSSSRKKSSSSRHSRPPAYARYDSQRRSRWSGGSTVTLYDRSFGSIVLRHLFWNSYVIANDLSPAATAAMRRNVELNGLGPKATAAVDPSSASLTKDCGDTAMAESSTTATQRGQPELDLGKVRVNQGDAW